MKVFAAAFFVISLIGGTSSVFAVSGQTRTLQNEIVEHGGGCRKSSPPSQCCHMDHKTGIVHCH